MRRLLVDEGKQVAWCLAPSMRLIYMGGTTWLRSPAVIHVGRALRDISGKRERELIFPHTVKLAPKSTEMDGGQADL